MLTHTEILQTIRMIDQENLDIRTITLGISLLDCADADGAASCRKVYEKICRVAQNLVSVGDGIEREYGGLFGRAPVMNVSRFSSKAFIDRGGRIPAPLNSLKN